MPSLNISPLSVSFDSFVNELKILVSKKPDAFKDFFDTGAGSAVIDMAATLATFYFYHLVSQRREILLSSAQDYSSILGSAADKAYSSYRGNNLKIRLRVKPSVAITLSKWTIMGSYQDYDIVLAEDTAFTPGLVTEIDVIIGKLKEEVISVAATDITIFRFSSNYVSEDFALLLNGVVLPVSSEFKDLLADNYVAISNSYGAIDVYYLQKGEYNYKPTDQLTLRYVERDSSVTNSTFELSQLSITGTEIMSYTILSDFQPSESKSSIKVMAPLYNDTSNVVRARADFKKVIKNSISSIASCEDLDVTPGLIALCALKNDETLLTEAELADINAKFGTAKASAVSLTQFVPAKLSRVRLKVVLTRDSSVSAGLSTAALIQEKLVNYENTLKVSLDTKDLESEIEDLAGVKVATPTFNTTVWEAKHSYLPTDVVIPTDFKNYAYTMLETRNRTGSSKPTWGANIVYDNDICWKKYNAISTGVQRWVPNKATPILSLVQDENTGLVYQCDHFIHKTGETEPKNWSDDYIVDGNVYWKLVSSPSKTPVNWTPKTDKVIGDCLETKVKVLNEQGELVRTDTHYYVCVGFAYTSSSKEPTWGEDVLVEDARIVWQKTPYPARRITLPWDTYTKIDLELEVEI